MFISLVTYGMWVATSVAAEKSSRVMELLVSAATPLQLLTGKVLGVGAAGLTQYLAIVLPGGVVLLLQDRIAGLVLGPGSSEGAPMVGLTPGLLIAYGLFFLLGLGLYTLLYAGAGSLVSRQEDVQQLAMPLSLLTMGGYIITIAGLGSVSSGWFVGLSFIPFFSPFVMLARVMVGRAQPFEIVLSVGLLLASIVAAAVIAARVYSAGVLLYGQRPGIRAYIAAARLRR
jgi:ABC-2 type transport system permease protein